MRRERSRTALLPFLLLLTAAAPLELQQWRDQAARVTITRDDWGIAHVRGRSDADAIFGMIYAQAEDDFPRIEANYLTALGRTAEADGEKAIWQDLRARLYVSEEELKAHYASSSDWLKRLMDSWAAGLNFYLATHPQVHPRVLTRFEPWMALSFTEGSIGGDIERIDLDALKAFYTKTRGEVAPAPQLERQGSNGIAIAPAITTEGRSLLLINPHTSWYFRSEQQVTSDEGLNVYGAATWGQFFIYQGFNQHAGWMHTSSGVDNVDEFAEKIERRDTGYCYRYGKACRAVGLRPVTVRYRAPDGRLLSRSFSTLRTHHGPIVREANGRWIAFAMMNKPVAAIEQSFLRTKARDLADFLKVAELKANSSNDTVFADGKGDIAMLVPQFMPRRDRRFDFTRPVEGSDPATDWGPLHALSELPSTISPRNGWVQNTNTWPYRAAGPNSPDPRRFPKYMDMFGENWRGIHALQLLTGNKGWTLDKLQIAAFDNYQPGFAALIPSLVKAYDALPEKDQRRARLAGAIDRLRTWDCRWSNASVAQSLAMVTGRNLQTSLDAPADEPRNITMMRLVRDTTSAQKLQALSDAVATLRRDFGRWQVPWGEINRFQRISVAISEEAYSDAAPSIPVPFADGNYGSLASVRSGPKRGTKRWYGDYGNSFVAVVEFGPRVRARAVSAGGESGDPTSPHFTDQARRYASGNLRDVYFYPDQLQGHVERRYHPGE
jgi:acyl-homoserine-lactone acylase